MASILVTGASRGIGRATCVSLGRAGHRVFATMRDPSRAPALSAIASAESLPILVSALDVDRIKAHAFGPSSLFEAWVAQERANTPIVAHAVITKSYDIRRACPTVVLCELYVVPERRRGDEQEHTTGTAM